MEKENDAGETIEYFYCNNRLKPPVVTNCKASVIARKGDSEEQLNEDDDDNIPEANWSIIRTNHQHTGHIPSAVMEKVAIAT